jgi:hypothetical protein
MQSSKLAFDHVVHLAFVKHWSKEDKVTWHLIMFAFDLILLKPENKK